ncbi:MAG TPA: hypothetical protein VFT84_01225, partial [Gemmatimonadales bacterium]|nr:hypothetical protein [Gemmatimonadales bacterium]
LFIAGLTACNRSAGVSERVREAEAAEAASGGVELEAPRLIPGLRAQLTELGDPDAGMTEGNVTAYRNLAGDVIDAMRTDLNRVGSPEAPRIDALGDSVVTLVGGGPGGAAIGTPEEVASSVRLMDRVIRQYQDAMREARL